MVSSDLNPKRDSHLYGLDILRFIAALLVVYFHFGLFSDAEPAFPAAQQDRAWPWMEQVTSHGWVGVQVFFVISGFVIVASADRSAPIEFLKHRAIRILPALWVYTFIAFTVRYVAGEPLSLLLDSFFRSIILFPVGPYIDGVIWTLVVEAIFYSLIALLLAVRLRMPNFDIFQACAITLGLASTCYLAILGILSLMEPIGNAGRLQSLLDRYFFSVLLLRHGVFFAIGMLVWRSEKDGYNALRSSLLLLYVGAAILQIVLQANGHNPVAPVIIWGGMLVFFVISLRHNSTVKRVGSSSLLRNLGNLSYPIYLGHFVIGMHLIPAIGEYVRQDLLLLLIASAIVFGLAWAVMVGPERLLQTSAKARLLGVPAAR
ncbi:acyltransferase [Roseovarius sp. SK2]|uniref:acyltransferase family protein n=1 Tax=Roseovarius TaxID=74030 RepID=UPI00237C00D9|nr:acyltransferase [Roseovarius sp. SK2]MDD9724530.1 acyltransferase [Roseovarius sp. SK2]